MEGRDYELSLQDKTTSREKNDKAPKKLFRRVKWSKLFGKPTFRGLMSKYLLSFIYEPVRLTFFSEQKVVAYEMRCFSSRSMDNT